MMKVLLQELLLVGQGATCEAGVVSQIDLPETIRGMDSEVCVSMAHVSRG